MWYRDKVRVEREADGGKSRSGSPIKTIALVYDPLPCDLIVKSQDDNDGADEGRTVVTTIEMRCKVVDIQTNDIVTNLKNGERMSVISVVPHTLLPYLEITLKGGVL